MKWYERVNWAAVSFVVAASGALYYGAKHGMTVDQIVAAAAGIATLAAQFEKLFRKQPEAP